MNNKNDIDSILNSMFRGGQLNMKSPAAKEAEKALDAVQSAQQDLSASLQQRIERMTQEAELGAQLPVQLSAELPAGLEAQLPAENRPANPPDLGLAEIQAELAALGKRLESDGVPQPANNAGNTRDLDAAFATARGEALTRVIGQDEFVDSLILAFKRPFVAGASDSLPLCRAALLGRPGTGRRTAVEAVTASLGRQGVLKTPKSVEIDLAAYNAPGSEKLFVQDLFTALKSGAAALLFAGYTQCHPSVLPLVTALFSTGSVPLPGRYAEQKGLLVDVGTALAPGAVSSLSAAGKYLFLLAGEDLSRLTGAFGSIFVSGLDDVLSTGDFARSSLERIGSIQLKALAARAEKQLGFRLAYDEEAVKALAGKFTREKGAAAIVDGANQLYKAMSEEKLRKSLPGNLCATLQVGENGLSVAYEAGGVRGEIVPGGLGNSAGEAELGLVKAELDRIVGLDSVKDYILSLEDNFKMQRLRRERGLKAEQPSMHMIFTGNPGTGKTTVARLVARYLKAIGALTGGQLVEVTRADLVGQYVGHTAPLTQKALQSAMGGVLFIDEAYALYRGRDDSFGLEAIDALVKGMEDHRDQLVVILAGYSREMEEFLTANSGLRSRFPNIIEFPDYTAQELLDITKSIVREMGYRLSPDCEAPLLGYYEAQQLTGDPRVNGNGRMARNKVEAAVIACSRRNMKAPEGERDLELLIPEDFGYEGVKGGEA